MIFIATDLGDDVDINSFVNEKGIENISLKWEEPIRFKYLNGEIYLYQFGAVVGVNLEIHEFSDILKELDRFVKGKVIHGEFEILEVNERDENIQIENDKLYIPKIDERSVYVISFALAQSVSLSRMESYMDNLEDEIEKVINKRKPFRSKKALDSAIKILQVKHEILSDIMILDKPSITWESEFLDDLYEKLSMNYEIKRRYRTLEAKLNAAFESVYLLLNIANEAKGNFLEFLIVILIIIEIFLWIFEMIKF